MQLFFMEDQYMIQALSSDTPQKAFTDRIGARCVIRRFENLNACAGYLEYPFRLEHQLKLQSLLGIDFGYKFNHPYL